MPDPNNPAAPPAVTDEEIRERHERRPVHETPRDYELGQGGQERPLPYELDPVERERLQREAERAMAPQSPFRMPPRHTPVESLPQEVLDRINKASADAAVLPTAERPLTAQEQADRATTKNAPLTPPPQPPTADVLARVEEQFQAYEKRIEMAQRGEMAFVWLLSSYTSSINHCTAGLNRLTVEDWKVYAALIQDLYSASGALMDRIRFLAGKPPLELRDPAEEMVIHRTLDSLRASTR